MDKPKNIQKIILETKNITKSFGEVIANNKINFDLVEGEVHTLLGENGAGKTTFVNILFGLYRPDEGEIFLNGKKEIIEDSGHAIKFGVGMVHQNFMLIGPFNVAENITIGNWQKNQFFINPNNLIKQVDQTTKHYGLECDLGATASELPVGVQQKVEIVKSLYRGARILILDEPTAVLTPQETQKLFDNIRNLSKNGISIIFISHKLTEVLEISDRITVFRNGEVVGTVKKTGTDQKQLTKMMIGRDLGVYPKKPYKKQETKLRVVNLFDKDSKGVVRLANISFDVEKGQILGFAGIDGNGQMELANAISGIKPAAEGELFINGTQVMASNMSPKVFSTLGGAYIPQDRFKTGVIPEFLVYENLMLKDYDNSDNVKMGFLQFEKIKARANELITKYDVRPANINLLTRKLSGGNLQKTILARELSANPSMIIASYPTRGLDIGATEFVLQQLLLKRAEGVSIMLFSNELDELLYMSDVIAVLHRGKIIDILEPSKTTKEDIGLLMMGEKR